MIRAGDLSFCQEQLWLTNQARSAAAPFLECTPALTVVVRLRNRLDRRALRAAVGTIVRRHDVLRSRFEVADNGVPSVVYEPRIPNPFNTIDLAGISPPRRSSAAMRFLTSLVQRPCELSRGPLLRVHLLALAHDLHILAIVVHHIIFDRWSKRILVSELNELYEAYTSARPARSPCLTASYGDYVRWQRDQIETPAGQELAAYWTARLRAIDELSVPCDGGSAERSTRAGECWFRIRAADVRRLRERSRRSRVTLATMLLTIFLLFLHRESGQQDVAVGVPLSDRRRPEFEPLIGFFMNVVVLRTTISDDLDFDALLDRVRRDLFDACRCQDLPYGYLLKLVRPVRPLYRAVFNFMPAIAGSDVALKGVEATPLTIRPTSESATDLSLHVRPYRGALLCRLMYKADLFTSARAKSYAATVQRLITSVAAHRSQSATSCVGSA